MMEMLDLDHQGRLIWEVQGSAGEKRGEVEREAATGSGQVRALGLGSERKGGTLAAGLHACLQAQLLLLSSACIMQAHGLRANLPAKGILPPHPT